MILTVKHPLLSRWLFTAALGAPTLQAGHLEGPAGLDFQREVTTGATGGFGSSGSFGSFGSFGTPHFNCNRPGETAANCGLGAGIDPDTTPFLQELVNDGGRTYYHMIIGLPGQAFVQETFMVLAGDPLPEPTVPAVGRPVACASGAIPKVWRAVAGIRCATMPRLLPVSQPAIPLRP